MSIVANGQDMYGLHSTNCNCMPSAGSAGSLPWGEGNPQPWPSSNIPISLLLAHHLSPTPIPAHSSALSWVCIAGTRIKLSQWYLTCTKKSLGEVLYKRKQNSYVVIIIMREEEGLIYARMSAKHFITFISFHPQKPLAAHILRRGSWRSSKMLNDFSKGIWMQNRA